MEYLNKQEYNLSLLQENVEVIIYSTIAFFAPFFMGHPQWFVGVIVNTSLVLAALNMKSWKMLPIIILPSIAVLTRGLIFGPYTIFLVYMIPAIWIGNTLLVWAVKKFYVGRNYNRFASLGMGAVVKTAFLFAIAFLLVNISMLPAIFLTAMGLMQLYTAVAGGVLAFGIHEIKKRLA